MLIKKVLRLLFLWYLFLIISHNFIILLIISVCLEESDGTLTNVLISTICSISIEMVMITNIFVLVMNTIVLSFLILLVLLNKSLLKWFKGPPFNLSWKFLWNIHDCGFSNFDKRSCLLFHDLFSCKSSAYHDILQTQLPVFSWRSIIRISLAQGMMFNGSILNELGSC